MKTGWLAGSYESPEHRPSPEARLGFQHRCRLPHERWEIALVESRAARSRLGICSAGPGARDVTLAVPDDSFVFQAACIDCKEH